MHDAKKVGIIGKEKINEYSFSRNTSGFNLKEKDVWFPWLRIPALSGDVLGGRKTLVLFRYISWFLTSVFYLLSSAQPNMLFKAGIILALLLSTMVAVRLYSKKKGSRASTFGLIIADTLFIAVLLIPTGGLGSPFMWYSLNPIFMSISLLPMVYCWGLLGFMLAAVAGSSLYYGSTADLFEVWRDNSWFTLVFLLLTTAALLFARLVKQLTESYERLSDAHRSTELLLEHISDLYHAMESFSVGEDPRQLAVLLADYSRRLTGTRGGFCYLIQGQYKCFWETSDPDGMLNHLKYRNIDYIWRKVQDKQDQISRLPLLHNVLDGLEIVCVPLRSPGAFFGLIGYVAYSRQNFLVNEEKAIKYLAELVAIILERRRADDLSARLMVAEEQSRIANEIHDGVSQHLFSIVYALHALSLQQKGLQEQDVQQQLGLIKKAANQAARDLRSSIYQISPSKRGEQVFLDSVSAYLEDLGRLNNISVEFSPEGTEDTLSPALRKALYRIINEATSNAIRHGECKNIQVELQMSPGKVILQIVDDGRGFKLSKQKQNGLGLGNMSSLIKSFGGRMTVHSRPGKGTRVICALPEDALSKTCLDGGAEDESRCG